jgi:hypothetical protein
MPSKRTVKKENGRYFVGGKQYDMLVGSRAQVFHDTAYRTTGRLVKSDLFMKNGRIKSRAKSRIAKKNNTLVRSGYVTKKGEFGSYLKSSYNGKQRRSSKRRSSKRRSSKRRSSKRRSSKRRSSKRS